MALKSEAKTFQICHKSCTHFAGYILNEKTVTLEELAEGTGDEKKVKRGVNPRNNPGVNPGVNPGMNPGVNPGVNPG